MAKIYKLLMIIILILCALPFVYYLNVENHQVTQIKKELYNKKLSVVGVIQSDEQTEISMAYPVYIKKCYVNENSYVNKGQILFTLDLEKMLSTAKAYDFTDTKTSSFTFNNENLLGISREICASESGIVKEITAQSGALVMAEDNLCIIEKADKPILKITLNQEDYSNVEIGDRIEFNPVIAPSRKYSATVTDKTAVIRKENSLTGNKTVIDVFADIDFADEYIYQGVQISGILSKENGKTIYTLPYQFINQDEKGEYVNIYENGHIKKEYIDIGIETETSAEILTTFALNTLFIKDNYKGKLLLEYDK